MPLQRKHIISAAALALAVGTASSVGFIPYWESGGHMSLVVTQQSIDRRGVYTVCDGITNLHPQFSWIKPGMRFTEKQCKDAFASLLPGYEAKIQACVPAYKNYPPHRQVSLLSFSYNLGPAAICGGRGHSDRIAREFNAGHVAVGCRLMGDYIRANRKVLSGLEQRRNGRPHKERLRFGPAWGEIAWCLRDD